MHPATLYGFITGALTIVGLIVLLALGHVTSGEALPSIAGLSGVGVGVAGGVATPNPPSGTGTVGTADPEG